MVGLMFHRLVDALDSYVPRAVKRRLKTAFPGIDRRVYTALRSVTSADVVPVVIKGGPLKGRSFCCSLRDERDYWLGIHEPGVQAAVAERLMAGDVFYDVGVHKGFFSLLGAACVGDAGLVVGFEPNPENRKWITRNLSINPDLGSRVVLEPNAVAEGTKTQTFVGSPGSATGRLIGEDVRGSDETTEFVVRAVSIDDYVAEHGRPPTVVKMDIEGGESAALRGMSMTLSKYRPTVIIEIHDEKAAAELINVVNQYDYECRDVEGHRVDVSRGFGGRDQFVIVPRSTRDV